MATDPLYNRLLELSWRRKLTEAEDAELRGWLAAHPELQNDWEVESLLNEGLSRLPDVPLASNFTAQVVGQIERQRFEPKRRYGWLARWTRIGWLPKTAFAALVVVVGFGGYHHVQQVHRQELVAQSIAELSRVRAPSTKTLQDFDAILALSASQGADETLLTLLQ
jgi:hypothetical protein